ncbi:MAG: hypothetical protein Q7T26_01835 [Dehalococcoidia bacterium]|nr:hypothetical protein [Dehalococcoidia bacterium]
MKLPLERVLTILTVVLLVAIAGIGYSYYQGIGQLADTEEETTSTAARLVLLKRSRELAPLSTTLKEKEQQLAQAEKGIPLTGSTLSIYDVVTSASQRTGVGLRTVEFVGTEVPSATTSPTPSPTPARPPAPPRATATPLAPPRYAVARFTVSASGSLDQASKFIRDLQSTKDVSLVPDDISVIREKDSWLVSVALLQIIRSG